MKISEIILDYLNDTMLFEMAYERKKALAEISSLQHTMAMHFIKVMAFDDQARNHWLNELNGYLFKIQDIRLKPNNKRFSPDVYYKLLWDEPLNNGGDFITDVVDRMVNVEGYTCARSSMTDQDIYETLEKVIHKVSYDISSNKFRDIKNYL